MDTPFPPQQADDQHTHPEQPEAPSENTLNHQQAPSPTQTPHDPVPTDLNHRLVKPTQTFFDWLGYSREVTQGQLDIFDLGVLQQTLDQAHALYEFAPCGYLSIDANHRFVKINQTLLDWLGYSREEALDQLDIFDLIDASWRQAVHDRLEALREGGQKEAMEIELIRKNGTRFRALLSSTAVCNEEGHFLHINTTLVNIIDRRAAAQSVVAQDKFLQHIADRMPTRLAYYDKDLICRFASAAHASRYGKRATDMVGSHLSEVVHPDLLPEIFPHVTAALAGQVAIFEVERIATDGTRNFVEIHYIPDYQQDVVEGIFIELHDISEHRRAEILERNTHRELEERVRQRTAELFQTEQRYRLMVDTVKDCCIYFIDAEGLVSDWTESAQRLHGHSPAQMLGRPYRALLPTDSADDEMDPDHVLQLAKAHGQWETLGWRHREDGTRFWAHTVLTALRNEAGELQGLSSITRDMTETKKLEDEMKSLNRQQEQRITERTQQLEAAVKELDELCYTISHDLRAPLRHISSFVNLLEEQLGESVDDVALQYLRSTTKASYRLSAMMEGLLEYVRLGRVAITLQPVSLAPMIEGVISQLEEEKPGRPIEWVVAQDLPTIQADAKLLTQVWRHLLSNSVKYTRPRVKARIEVGWKANATGGHTFYVNDNGVGFDVDKAQNLFAMFQRQHHSMDFEGTGTGLALSQRIIQRHDGRIWAESAPGEGCTFYFILPSNGLKPPFNAADTTPPEPAT
ncbi:MAG: PAS domain S-box protein [Hydrogenophaga sp.]|uniref:PAS domain-containing sensor histidine kinase n=1 Tax=Hydrogenophaga sp. TaxID=1904254 RepID=UPI002764C1B5|nr:PAS domain S-box protein [Hydrogenophaga sp.]MDP2418396.1 PAS domain S-box protein [Hydrogenophaga sp.]MDZ4187654.1 PAS domain S-box protein [Hydrogenophaga sp.]